MRPSPTKPMVCMMRVYPRHRGRHDPIPWRRFRLSQCFHGRPGLPLDLSRPPGIPALERRSGRIVPARDEIVPSHEGRGEVARPGIGVEGAATMQDAIVLDQKALARLEAEDLLVTWAVRPAETGPLGLVVA